MKELRPYNIPFTGLEDGTHDFEYQVDDAFFALFEQDDLRQVDIAVDIVLEKRPNMLTFTFSIEGNAQTTCDRCAEDMDLLLRGSHQLIVKFGEREYEQTDEIVVLPANEHQINVAQYIYEFVNLAIPARRVHPEGECDEEAIEKLNQYRVSEKPDANDDDDDPPTDPRWSKLSGLNLN